MRTTRWGRQGLAVLVAVMVTVAAAVGLQGAGDGVKSRVEQYFSIANLRASIVLVPKVATDRYNNIEITDDGAVLVDGSPVTGKELRTRVGTAADVVAQLSVMDAAARRAMFARSAVPTEPAPPVAPVPAPEPQIQPPARPDTHEAVPDERDRTPERDVWVEREHRSGARVRVGGDIWVKTGESAGDAVVAVFGSVKIDGRVEGDVVAVGGGIALGPEADVRGNVVAVGGTIDRDPGARIDGDINEVHIGFPSIRPWFRVGRWFDWHRFGWGWDASADLFASLLRMGLIGLLVAMVIATSTTGVRRVSYAAAHEPWRAGLIGLAFQLFLVPVTVVSTLVLVVSIVGIPLLTLVPVGVLLLLIGLFLGFAGAGHAIGTLVTRRIGGQRLTVLAAVVVGMVVVFSLTAIARFAGLAGQPIRALASVLLIAGFVIEYAAWTVGFGAVLMTRFGRRGPVEPAPDVPPPPPAFDEYEHGPARL